MLEVMSTNSFQMINHYSLSLCTSIFHFISINKNHHTNVSKDRQYVELNMLN